MMTPQDFAKSIRAENVAQSIYLPLFAMSVQPKPKSALANPFARGTPPRRHKITDRAARKRTAKARELEGLKADRPLKYVHPGAKREAMEIEARFPRPATRKLFGRVKKATAK